MVISNMDSFHSLSTSGCSYVSIDDSLGDILKSILNIADKNLNICHINAQSILAHYTGLAYAIHACLVSESFLKPFSPFTLYAIPKYTLICNDRTGKGGVGGVLYLKSNLPYKVEYIFLELTLDTVPFLIGMAYAPPTVNYFVSFEELLETYIA